MSPGHVLPLLIMLVDLEARAVLQTRSGGDVLALSLDGTSLYVHSSWRLTGNRTR
jgi:hypothetical protein